MARQSPFMPSTQFTYPTNYPQRDARYPTSNTVETSMSLNRRPSLLAGYHNHFASPDRVSLASYYPSIPPISMGPHVDEHSKRSRYPAGSTVSLNSQLLPLSIDIKKEQQVYQPQTEAISPTPDEPKTDSNIRDSTIIRNAISKLESEIDINMKKLHRAKLSQSEIKSQADRSAADDEENDNRDDLLKANGSQTLIEKILHENRKKAEDSHRVFQHMNNNMDLTIPFYQEPNDLESIQRIRIQYITLMKNKLKEFFKKKHEMNTQRIKIQSEIYDKNYQVWQKSIEKEEKIQLNKDIITYREIFEKTFPELRKTREDKEKKQSNANDSSTTEQQLNLNSNTIEQETETEEEKMRKSSVVPPMLHDTWQRRHQYFNQNGLITRDAAEFYKERTKMPYWSPEEKQIFIEKFTQSPKNFGYISSFLENKTTEQCVQFYYMTKKTENYKNLLRKQAPGSRRKAKQNTTAVENAFVPKVSSSNTIASSSSSTQQGTGQSTSTATTVGQDADRPSDRLENDEERRDHNMGDGVNEEKRANKNRCQLLSCTTDKFGKKKNRKNRLRAFPTKWNDLTKENQEAIRRILQIPSNVQRCCTRCYEKLIVQIRQRQTTSQPIEEEDDDDDDSSKIQINKTNEQCSTNDNEWNEQEIEAFIEARNKFNDDWTRIAEYVRRSEQSCREFSQKYHKKNCLIDNEQNNDEDNGSQSGSEDINRRSKVENKSRENEQNDEDNYDDLHKTIINDDSNDSTRGMVIDDNDEQVSIIEEKNEKTKYSTNNFSTASIVTINSLVEKEIMKTLNETDKRSSNNTNSNLSDKNSSAAKSTMNLSNPNPPPPLVTLTKSHSPPIHSHNSQTFVNKGSIMRGTPISPSNKPISVDTSISHSHIHPHHYSSPRNEYSHHPSTYTDSLHTKSSKLTEQQLYLQQQAYLRHLSHQHGTHSNFPSSSTSSATTPNSSQYLQSHKAPLMNNSQQQNNKSLGIDASNTDTYETLRADFVTSRYLNATHSPNHDRQSRHPSEQRSPSQTTSTSSNNPQILPSPIAIPTSTSNSSNQPSAHSHHSQQHAALLAAQQLLVSSGMYPQDFYSAGILPYSHFYGSSPSGSFYMDPRLMHEFSAVANSEQLKALRANRHLPHTSTHSPPDPSTYSSKRHSHENIDHMRYPNSDYASSIWRTQNNTQTQLKPNSGQNENPLSKLNDLSRHSTRHVSSNERDTRSPDDYHHRPSQTRPVIESSSTHFQRADALSHHKSSSIEKLNTNLQYSDHSSDLTNPSSYMRHSSNTHKSHSNHHSHQQTLNRSPLALPSQLSPHQASSYMFHGLHHSPVGTLSPQQQTSHHSAHHSQSRSSHHPDSTRNPKEPISIQEFMKKSVNEFVASTNTENKTLNNSDGPLSESSNNQIPRSAQPTSGTKSNDTNDQPILIDGDDDSSSAREQNDPSTDVNRSGQNVNKSTMESGDVPERRRDSSIKKILSNLPLEKQEYMEINQKVQNSSISASKVHSNNDYNGIERTNSTGGREPTRSRGSITMRMLMGANGIYADGKAQPMAPNEVLNEQSNKRAASPNDKSQSLEYLIRGELVRSCPPLSKSEEPSTIFQNRNLSSRLSPTTQQRISSSQQQTPKRMKTSTKDDFEQHSTSSHTNDSSSSMRDPFVLQSHPKHTHHQTNLSSSSLSSGGNDYNWQSCAQHSFGSRPSRSNAINSGSITQGSPISSTRLTSDQQHYPSSANNQLVNPAYSYYMTKNEQQISPSRQSSASPLDHSPKGRFHRRMQQMVSSPSDNQNESSLTTNIEQSTNLKSPPTTSIQINTNNSTPPIAVSPISSSTSPATSVSSSSAHPLKKRLISGYEFEQQQQQQQQQQVNSPTMISPPVVSVATSSPPISTNVETIQESINGSNTTKNEQNIEDISDAETTRETNPNQNDENDS